MAWIKFDKSLIDDPKILRATAILCDEYEVVKPFKGTDTVTEDRVHTMIRNAVTGALCTLWCYADTHIRAGDILPLSVYDIDRLVGIEGFCDAIGESWIQKTPEQNHVILPGYTAKNGLITKEKRSKSNAERQARYRERIRGNDRVPETPARAKSNGHSNGVSNASVTALDRDPDLDQKKTLRAVDGLDEKAWARWLAYRKSSGKTLKPASWESAMNAMVKLGADQMACVEQSVANGWTGLFALKSAAGVPATSEAATAWDDLIKSDGAKRNTKAQAAISAVGGWARIKERTIHETARLRVEFCRAYAEA